MVAKFIDLPVEGKIGRRILDVMTRPRQEIKCVFLQKHRQIIYLVHGSVYRYLAALISAAEMDGAVGNNRPPHHFPVPT